jgi:hypothetical protein
MFVFIYKNLEESNVAKKEIFKSQQALALERINLLKAKDRNVNLYYESEVLKVYQIENRERASNINELLF